MSRTNSPSPSVEHLADELLGASEIDARESYFVEEGEDARHERRRRELSKERESARDALDINGRELLSSVDFWLMFAFLGLCSGVGLMCKCSFTLSDRVFADPLLPQISTTSGSSEGLADSQLALTFPF